MTIIAIATILKRRQIAQGVIVHGPSTQKKYVSPPTDEGNYCLKVLFVSHIFSSTESLRAFLKKQILITMSQI